MKRTTTGVKMCGPCPHKKGSCCQYPDGYDDEDPDPCSMCHFPDGCPIDIVIPEKNSPKD